MGNSIIMTGGAGGIDPDECTAGRPQVLSGYTAGVHGEDDPVPGSMPERGTWSSSVGMNGSVIIPEGHHSGSGKVNGPVVTQRGAWNSRIGINGQVAIPEGYHNGQGYVDQVITTMGGQTINPSASQQTVATSGKYMTGNIIINKANVLKQLYVDTTIPTSTIACIPTNQNGGQVRNCYCVNISYTGISNIIAILGFTEYTGRYNMQSVYLAGIKDNYSGRVCTFMAGRTGISVDGNIIYVNNTSARLPICETSIYAGDAIRMHIIGY